MSGRRNKRTELSEPEIERFLDAATALHRACCDPLIAAWSEHGHAMADLNTAICEAILAVTHWQRG